MLIKYYHEKGQPVLVGTASIEKSEKLHKILSDKKIPHTVYEEKSSTPVSAQASTPVSSVQHEEAAPSRSRRSSGGSVEDQVKASWNNHSILDAQDWVSINKNLEGIENGIAKWKAGTSLVKCDNSNCNFPGSSIRTTLPNDVAHCPVCGMIFP